MKKFIVISLLAISPLIYVSGGNIYPEKPDRLNQDTLYINAGIENLHLAGALARAFSGSTGGVKIRESVVEAPEVGYDSPGEFMLMAGYPATPGDGRLLSFTIGRSILVPVINSGSRYYSGIMERGIDRSSLEKIATGKYRGVWGDLLGSDDAGTLRIYVDGSDLGRAMLSSFLGHGDSGAGLSAFEVTDDVPAMVSGDMNSVGFCLLADITQPGSAGLLPGYGIIPIDVNGNGTIDHMEDFTGSYEDFVRGVWIGKYPWSLCTDLRIVTAGSVLSETGFDFLGWVVTEGQELVADEGLTALIPWEVRSSLGDLYTALQPVTDLPESGGKPGKAFIVALVIMVCALIGGLLLIRFTVTADTGKLQGAGTGGGLKGDKPFPAGIQFDKSHTWSFMERSGLVRVGIDDFIQQVTGRVTRVKTRKPGEIVRRGEPLCTIVQEGKQLVLYSPLTGTVRKVNELLGTNPAALNASPYDEGWVYEIEPAKWKTEFGRYLMGDDYSRWIGTELKRIKDFFNSLSHSGLKPGTVPVMQEGGELADAVLEKMGPDVWEEFQTGFLDRTV